MSGRLLRKAQPDLMDALIQASKDGDNSRLLALAGQESWSIENEGEEEEEEKGGEEIPNEEVRRNMSPSLVFKHSADKLLIIRNRARVVMIL